MLVFQYGLYLLQLISILQLDFANENTCPPPGGGGAVFEMGNARYFDFIN